MLAKSGLFSANTGAAPLPATAGGRKVVENETVHASAVQMAGRGVLILGASGSGKSSLALRLIALGAVLIGDDRLILSRRDAALWAAAPAPIAGLIEARGVGLIRTEYAPGPVNLVVDLDRIESERLPPFRNTCVMGVTLPLVLGPLTDHLSSTISLLLRGGRLASDMEMLPVAR